MMVLENLSESTTFKQIPSPYNWNMSNLADAMKSNIHRLKEWKDKWSNIRLEYTVSHGTKQIQMLDKMLPQ